MKYDDASWHSGGDFPRDLPHEAAATHTGMFVAYALLTGLAGATHVSDFPDYISRLKARSSTPGALFLESCDGKFTDEDLNEVGNAFAVSYYDMEKGRFLSDYQSAVGDDLASLYHVPDTWDTYEALRPIFDLRFAEWQRNA